MTPLYQMRVSCDAGLTWKVQFLWTDINEAHRFVSNCQKHPAVNALREIYLVIEYE